MKTPSEMMDRLNTNHKPMPPGGGVTNDMLMAATQWPLTFDLESMHIRCVSCKQSVMSMGLKKQGKRIGYQATSQDIMGNTVMHMIQRHNFDREGVNHG
jgi:hypothetical protein